MTAGIAFRPGALVVPICAGLDKLVDAQPLLYGPGSRSEGPCHG